MIKFWKRKPDRVCSELDLRALETYTDDNGHSIARIDPDDMNALRVLPGDHIKIMGREEVLNPFDEGFGVPHTNDDLVYRCRTVVKCLPLVNRQDKGKNIIRIDGLTRSNVKCELGDTVTIRRLTIEELSMIAERVVLEPITDFAQYPFSSEDLRIIAKYAEGMTICTGNNIILRGLPEYGLPLIAFHVISYVCNGIDSLPHDSRSALIVEGTKWKLSQKRGTPESGDEKFG